mgnify:CR=1 FL=1
MDDENKYQTPFQMACQICGTLAESWHSAFAIPPDEIAGMGSCDCGALSVDSLGNPDRPQDGRVVYKDPRAIENQKKD